MEYSEEVKQQTALLDYSFLMNQLSISYQRSWLGGYATSRKVAGSSPDEVIGFFSIDLIIPAALWPWGRLSLEQK
jgi:hypothetical protein